jgi:hypothetical protein
MTRAEQTTRFPENSIAFKIGVQARMSKMCSILNKGCFVQETDRRDDLFISGVAFMSHAIAARQAS